jgi:hypothetical protein
VPSHSSYVLFLQLLSRGSTDVPALLAEVTQAWEATATVETSTWEAATVWDSATLRVKDVEDQASLAESVAPERVSRAEAENATALASAHEDDEFSV